MTETLAQGQIRRHKIWLWAKRMSNEITYSGGNVDQMLKLEDLREYLGIPKEDS